MGGCDVVINTTICGNSAVDKVAQLQANGVGLNEACKQVAAETDKEHGTTTKWTAVKKKVQRANNLGTVSPLKKKTTPKIPMVDSTTITTTCDKCLSLETEVAAKDARIEQLQKLLNDAIAELDKHIFIEADVLPTPSGPPQNMPKPHPQESTPYSMPRAEAFITITKYGNPMMQTAIKLDNVVNDKLFKMIKKIKQDLISSTPGGIISTNISNCVEVID